MARVDAYPNIDPNDQVELAGWETDENLPKGGRVVNITIPALLAYILSNSSGSGLAHIGTSPPANPPIGKLWVDTSGF